MKKYLTLLLLPLGFAACQPSKADMKTQFVKSCVDEAVKGASDAGMKAMFEKYCDCSGEKVVNHFSTKEIAAWNKMSQTEIQEQLMPVVKECTDKLTDEMTDYMTKNGVPE